MNTTTITAILESEIVNHSDSTMVSRLASFDNGKNDIVQFFISAYGKSGEFLREVSDASVVLAIGSMHFIKDEDGSYPEFEARQLYLAEGMECTAYVQVIGNLGGDPELKHSENLTIANLSLYSRRNKDESDIFRCVLYDRNADNAASYMKKGDKVAISGRLTFNTKDEAVYWQVNGYNFELLGGKRESGNSTSNRKPPAPKAKVTPKTESKELATTLPADIPF